MDRHQAAQRKLFRKLSSGEEVTETDIFEAQNYTAPPENQSSDEIKSWIFSKKQLYFFQTYPLVLVFVVLVIDAMWGRSVGVPVAKFWMGSHSFVFSPHFLVSIIILFLSVQMLRKNFDSLFLITTILFSLPIVLLLLIDLTPSMGPY